MFLFLNLNLRFGFDLRVPQPVGPHVRNEQKGKKKGLCRIIRSIYWSMSLEPEIVRMFTSRLVRSLPDRTRQ